MAGIYYNSRNSHSYLYSGPPYNYSYKETNLNVGKKEIIVIMNMNEKTIKFIIDNDDKGKSYKNIPIDKPIARVVFLLHSSDSVEINEY